MPTGSGTGCDRNREMRRHMKPAPTLPPMPTTPAQPLGLILSPEGYQDLGERAKSLGIRVAVDQSTPDRCEWFRSLSAFNSAAAGLSRP